MNDMMVVYPLRDQVLFPGQREKLRDMRDIGAGALQQLLGGEGRFIALSQVASHIDNPRSADFYEYGTEARLLGGELGAHGSHQLEFEGVRRVKVTRTQRQGDCLWAACQPFESRGPRPDEPLLEEVIHLARRCRERIRRLFLSEYKVPLDTTGDAEALLNGLAAALSYEHAPVRIKMKVLDKQDPSDQARVLKFFFLELLKPKAMDLG